MTETFNGYNNIINIKSYMWFYIQLQFLLNKKFNKILNLGLIYK